LLLPLAVLLLHCHRSVWYEFRLKVVWLACCGHTASWQRKRARTFVESSRHHRVSSRHHRVIIASSSIASSGVLLRPSWPATAVDASFTHSSAFIALKPLYLWTAQSVIGEHMYSYVISINLDKPLTLPVAAAAAASAVAISAGAALLLPAAAVRRCICDPVCCSVAVL
jgi:hypothetical protein